MAPVIWANALDNYHQKESIKIYLNDYFTTKNIVTGKIEKTNNTYSIHHFVTDYASAEDKMIRYLYQKINAIFGYKTILASFFSYFVGFYVKCRKYIKRAY
jgi:hypothetical protein